MFVFDSNCSIRDSVFVSTISDLLDNCFNDSVIFISLINMLFDNKCNDCVAFKFI